MNDWRGVDTAQLIERLKTLESRDARASRPSRDSIGLRFCDDFFDSVISLT